MSTLPPLALVGLLIVYAAHAIPLGVIDLREHRLPNRIVASLTLCLLATLAVCALVWPPMRAGILAAVLLAALTAVVGIAIALLAPVLIGMGDAKMAPSVVLLSAALGWDVLIGALLGVAILGGAVGVAILAVRRDASARFAYGPVLLAGPFLGMLLAPAVRGALGLS